MATIQELIGRADIDGAMKLLAQAFPNNNEIILLQTRWSSWKRADMLGIGASDTERNKIVQAILSYAQNITVNVSVDNSTNIVIVGNVPTTQSEYIAWIEKQTLDTIFSAVVDSSLPNELKDEMEDLQTKFKRAVRDAKNTPAFIADMKKDVLEKFNNHLEAVSAKKGEEETKLMKNVTDSISAITTNWDAVGKTLVHFRIANNKLSFGFESALERIKWIPTSGATDQSLLDEMRNEGMIGADEVKEAVRQLNLLVGKAWSELERRGIRRS